MPTDDAGWKVRVTRCSMSSSTRLRVRTRWRRSRIVQVFSHQAARSRRDPGRHLRRDGAAHGPPGRVWVPSTTPSEGAQGRPAQKTTPGSSVTGGIVGKAEIPSGHPVPAMISGRKMA